MISRSKPGQQLATQNGSWRGSPSFGASWPNSTPRWPGDWLGIRTCQHSVTYGRVTYGRPTSLGARHHRGHLTDGRDWPSGRQKGPSLRLHSAGTARPGLSPGSAADDLDLEHGAHIRMQPHRDLMRSDSPDRVADLDLAPVEFGTARVLDRCRDV